MIDIIHLKKKYVYTKFEYVLFLSPIIFLLNFKIFFILVAKPVGYHSNKYNQVHTSKISIFSKTEMYVVPKQRTYNKKATKDYL